jgi:putative hydrolase of the HAD superfamily
MLDLSLIKTVIFDLGGVVVDLDLNLSVNAFRDLGIKEPERFIQHGVHSDIFLKLEVGEITEKEFFAGIRELAGKDITEGEIRSAWCAMFTELPAERVRIIEKLKKEHRVILLSNTNSIHRDHFDGMADGYKSLSDLFHEVYYSFILHDHKPNISVFEKVLEKENIDPKETLFVDDAQKNIAAARETGMHTMLITPDRQMEDVFKL